MLIGEDGRVKVLDLGIAKLREGVDSGLDDETTQLLTREGQIVGTVPFISPEQIKGDSLDGRSDLFSLGVLLYQLAVGQYPFEGTGSNELLASILENSPRPVSEVRPALPVQLGRILDHCLEKEPRRRFQSALDLQNALQELESGETEQLTSGELDNIQPEWAPDSRLIYFSSYRGGGLNIWRLAVDREGRPQGVAGQMTTGAGDDLQLTLSPDGTAIAFAVLRLNSDLWTLPVDPETAQPTGPPEALVATTREHSRGAWSLDGSMLAFNSDRSGEMNLWLLDLSDGSTRQLTRGPGGDYQPQFAPDGSSLFFLSARAGNNDVWLLDLASETLTQLTDQAGLDMNPFFSPDGQWIAYHSDADGRLEAWLMRPDGSAKRALTSFGAAGHFLLWADDSRSLTVRAGGSAKSGVFRVEVETGNWTEHRPISSGSHMSYSPDRSLILDVVGHRTLLAYPVTGGDPREVFEFDNPDIHLDYPSWSPDGMQVVFDRAEPQGSDIWLLQGIL